MSIAFLSSHNKKITLPVVFRIKYLTWKEHTYAGRVKSAFLQELCRKSQQRENSSLVLSIFLSPSWLLTEFGIRICKNSTTPRIKTTSSVLVGLSKGWIWLFEVIWLEFSFKGKRIGKRIKREIWNKVPNVTKAMDGAVFNCSGKSRSWKYTGCECAETHKKKDCVWLPCGWLHW